MERFTYTPEPDDDGIGQKNITTTWKKEGDSDEYAHTNTSDYPHTNDDDKKEN